MDNESLKKFRIVEIKNNQGKGIGVTYFIVYGYPVANGIMASSRTDGDMPENIWNAGKTCYYTEGWEAAAKFAQKIAPEAIKLKDLKRAVQR